MASEATAWPERAPRVALAAIAASVLLSGLAASLLLTEHRILAGLVALASGAALLVGSLQGRAALPDGLGGRVRFTSRVLDVVFDASILVPLAWVMRSGSKWDAALAMLGLGFSYLASYQRARGEALGYAGSESLGYRLTREAILVLGLLSGWIGAALWAFTILALAAAVVRAWNILIRERHGRPVEKAAG